MRSVWLSMRDEEPPGRGMAELLAAARVKAEAMAPKQRWWQRLAAMLRRPPVLALATVLVLIGGAVLLGRRLGEDGGPARQVVAPARAPASASASAGSAPASASAGTASADAARAGAGAGGSGHSGAGRDDVRAGGVGAGVAKDAGTEQALRVSADPDDATRAQGAVRLRAPVAPPPAANAAPARAAAPDVGLVTRLGSAADARRAPLYQQCEAAARRGDCSAVRRLVAQISQTDPGYRARVVQDAAFARCLE